MKKPHSNLFYYLIAICFTLGIPWTAYSTESHFALDPRVSESLTKAKSTKSFNDLNEAIKSIQSPSERITQYFLASAEEPSDHKLRYDLAELWLRDQAAMGRATENHIPMMTKLYLSTFEYPAPTDEPTTRGSIGDHNIQFKMISMISRALKVDLTTVQFTVNDEIGRMKNLLKAGMEGSPSQELTDLLSESLNMVAATEARMKHSGSIKSPPSMPQRPERRPGLEVPPTESSSTNARSPQTVQSTETANTKHSTKWVAAGIIGLAIGLALWLKLRTKVS